MRRFFLDKHNTSLNRNLERYVTLLQFFFNFPDRVVLDVFEFSIFSSSSVTSNGFGDVDGEMDVDESIPDPLLSTIIGDRSSSLGDRSKICIVERRDVTNGELIGVDLRLKY